MGASQRRCLPCPPASRGMALTHTRLLLGPPVAAYCDCRYEGDWVDDVPNGKGRVWYSDGAFYEGDIVMFQRQGNGHCTFANGDR